jgi:hypothetical protein
MAEIFRVIRNYEQYSISNLSRIRNNESGHILKKQMQGNRAYVTMRCNQKYSKLNVRMLMANTFPADDLTKTIMSFRDGDCKNINSNNIELTTYSECFKVINNYAKYSISNFGRIRNNQSKAFLRQISNDGYLTVTLCDNKKRKTIAAHRLVAQAFLENDDPDNKTCVNHIDGKKENNHVTNLEYVTQSQNVQHAHDNKLIQKSVKAIKQLNQDGTLIKVFNSIAQAETELGISGAHISTVCSNSGRKSAGGFQWEYDDLNHLTKPSLPLAMMPISNYPNYGITKDGQIYSHFLKRFLHSTKKNGYMVVGLSNELGTNTFRVHRLVALTFIPNGAPITKRQVNHINSVRHDNHVSNLEWVTPSENVKHAHQAKRAREMCESFQEVPRKK